MVASQIKVGPWQDFTNKSLKEQNRKYYKLMGSKINKCFGKVQMYKHPKHGYTTIRAMISTEDPFVKTIPYTEDWKAINEVWRNLMNKLLDKIFDTNL